MTPSDAARLSRLREVRFRRALVERLRQEGRCRAAEADLAAAERQGEAARTDREAACAHGYARMKGRATKAPALDRFNGALDRLDERCADAQRRAARARQRLDEAETARADAAVAERQADRRKRAGAQLVEMLRRRAQQSQTRRQGLIEDGRIEDRLVLPGTEA
jgi:hypothetical protein